jgi:ParB family transcriptional regulator, chromosome partitioning protein
MATVVREIPVDCIDSSPRNPRRRLDHLHELADSLREHGLLQPIVVRAHPSEAGRYELVAGHRRLAAALSLGWSRIPAAVRSAESDTAYVLTLVENLQRQDLSPRDESQALETLVRERGWSTRQVANAVKRSQSYVSRRLRVFEDPIVGPFVLQDRLSISAAEELLPLQPGRKRKLALQAVRQKWDRTRVRRAIQQSNPASHVPRRTLLARAREFRQALQAAVASELTEPERRELRLAFQDLAMLAKAPTEEQSLVFPPLRQVARTGHR